jgi:hypothetical protein
MGYNGPAPPGKSGPIASPAPPPKKGSHKEPTPKKREEPSGGLGWLWWWLLFLS